MKYFEYYYPGKPDAIIHPLIKEPREFTLHKQAKLRVETYLQNQQDGRPPFSQPVNVLCIFSFSRNSKRGYPHYYPPVHLLIANHLLLAKGIIFANMNIIMREQGEKIITNKDYTRIIVTYADYEEKRRD